MARPSKYETEVKDKLILVEGWVRDGLTDEQICHNLGISTTSLYEYKSKYSEFAECFKKGREVADYLVENALMKSALGYHFDEHVMTKEGPATVTKYAQPNTTAQIFWLKNRRSDKWRDKPDAEERYKKLIALLGKLNLSEDEINELVSNL